MKNISYIKKVIVISMLTAFGCLATFAQMPASPIDPVDTSSVSKELRPFDFTDKFYSTNGVEAAYLINRRNGADGDSVFDFTSDENYSNVRILATRPAYAYDGSPVYWNLYSEFFKEAFQADAAGDQARQLAESFPIYIFPSVTQKNKERQAALIANFEGYFDKNQLGIGIVMVVDFTGAAGTRDNAQFLSDLGKRNGFSLDGTPIVRSISDLKGLQRRNLVTVRVRGTDNNVGQAPFMTAKIIREPAGGALAPDAFLVNVKQRDGQPLPSEEFFAENFNCYKGAGCGAIR